MRARHQLNSTSLGRRALARRTGPGGAEVIVVGGVVRVAAVGWNRRSQRDVLIARLAVGVHPPRRDLVVGPTVPDEDVVNQPAGDRELQQAEC